MTLHGGRPSSRSSQRSSTGGPLTYAFSRRPSSGGSRGPLVPSSRAGAARAAAILLISCHLQATKGGNKHRRTLSDVAEGSSDGLGRRSTIFLTLSFSVFYSLLSIRISHTLYTTCASVVNTPFNTSSSISSSISSSSSSSSSSSRSNFPVLFHPSFIVRLS